jgi:hypothetical protein
VGIIKAIYLLIRAFVISRLSLAVEILALRQQIAVYQHTVKHPKLRPRDRLFWVWLSRLWANWRSALAIVQPETVSYGDYFTKRVESMGIEEVPIAPRSPWQNPYCERVIGSIRRDCLDHVIVLNERHLHRILADYFDYYHTSRPHPSLDRNSPTPRAVEPPSQGEVHSIPQVGGLHHRYTRAA